MLFRGSSFACSRRQKRPDFMQHFLKAPPGSAGTRIVPAEFLGKLLVSMNDLDATLDVRFGREALATFICGFESRNPRRTGVGRCWAWRTP